MSHYDDINFKKTIEEMDSLIMQAENMLDRTLSLRGKYLSISLSTSISNSIFFFLFQSRLRSFLENFLTNKFSKILNFFRKY